MSSQNKKKKGRKKFLVFLQSLFGGFCSFTAGILTSNKWLVNSFVMKGSKLCPFCLLKVLANLSIISGSCWNKSGELKCSFSCSESTRPLRENTLKNFQETLQGIDAKLGIKYPKILIESPFLLLKNKVLVFKYIWKNLWLHKKENY